jgi:hypothetical protein
MSVETPAPLFASSPSPASRRPGLSGFWKFVTLFSFVINVVLVLVLLILITQLFAIRNKIAKPLIGGLYENFVAMDAAHIRTSALVSDTILVQDTMPVVFDLPLNADTIVVLTKDTPIPQTMVNIDTGIINLNVPAVVTLPKGTPLSIHLSLVVPVSQTIPFTLKVPVKLNVPVDIPLNQTELHEPFTNFALLVAPYNELLNKTPGSLKELFGIK